MPGDWGGRAARGRQLYLPTHPQWKLERAVDYGGRKRRRSHPGQATAAQRQ